MAKKLPEVKKPNLKYLRDKHREMVKGIFRFHEVPGGTMQFSFKAFKEDPVENYSFQDGGVYTIPLGVAIHLNKNCWYPIHGYQEQEDGKHTVKVSQKVHRTSFQSLEFVDLDDLPAPDLVTVEHQVAQPDLIL